MNCWASTYKQNLIIYSAFLLSCFYVKAQNQSLTQLDEVFTRFNKIYRNDADNAIKLLDSLYDMVSENGQDIQKYNYHLNYFKVLYYIKGDKNKTAFHLHQAKKYSSSYKEKALVYNKLGQFHHRMSGLLDSSVYYQFKAIENIKKHSDPYSLTHYYLDLGNVYETLGDYTKAAEYMEKSLEIAKKGGKSKDYGYSLYNTINVYKTLKDTTKIKLLEDEYAAFKEGKTIQSSAAHKNSSFTPDQKDKKSFLEKSIQKNEKSNNFTTLSAHRLILADQLAEIKNYGRAIKILEDGLMSLSDSILLFRFQYFTKLKKLNELNHQYKNALMYADSVRSVEKMILDEKRIMTIKDLEAKYNKLEQDNQILLLQKQQDSARRNLYMALLGVGLLFSLLTGIYLLYHQKSKSNKILEQKNKQINLMLHEKDLLLREIHHRVKNNLQVVSSLLNLQSDHITDEIALDAINTGKTRVGSMALIHQNLYNHNNLSSIRTKEYFDDLTEQIFDTYNVDKNRIKIIKKIDDVSLDVEMMIPVGLIVNELLTNCLKHAFHHKEHGIIELSIEDLHDEIKISVKDNGPGLDIQKFDHSDSFGHKMVRAFIQKLKSELLIKNNNGAYFSFMLKKENINITKQAG